MTAVSASPNPILRFTDNAGNALNGGQLLTQVGGVNYATYSDSAGTVQLPNPIILNSRGEVATSTGVSTPMYLDESVSYVFTLSDALGNLLWSTPPITPPATLDGLLTELTSDILGGILFPLSTAEGNANIIPTDFSYTWGDVRRYGGDPTGTTASDAAFTAAFGQAAQVGGSPVFAPGNWKISSGVVITGDGTKMSNCGMGPTTFLAGQNTITMLKVAASNCQLESFRMDGNGFTAVEGAVLAPVSETSTTQTTQVNSNVFGALEFRNLKEGLRLRAGPSVSGTDSGVFFNTFNGIQIHDCIRGIWLQDSIAAGFGAPNRNTFTGICLNSTGTVINTGLQIDSGATNAFFKTDGEGISNGTVPNATPTAIKIVKTGANGLDNNDNQFFGCFLEGNTIDLDNANPTTAFFGGELDATKFACGVTISSITISGVTATVTCATAHGLGNNQPVHLRGQTPSQFSGLFTGTVVSTTVFSYTVAAIPTGNATIMGTFDVPPRTLLGQSPGGAPTLDSWYAYSEGLPGYPSGYVGLRKEVADLNKQWQTQPLVVGNVINATSLGVVTLSKFRILGNMCSWHMLLNFQATVGGTNIQVQAPAIANATLYLSAATTNAWYSLFVEDGSGTRKSVEAGWTTGGNLYVKAPGSGWTTGSAANIIWLAIEFHL